MARPFRDGVKGLGSSWFSLALLGILLLAIPGFVLFGLNVFGGEAQANAWLKDQYQLTYHIPFVWWLAGIVLLVPIAIVLLYFLKLKRKPLSVPSTFLWRKSIEDLHVNALFQWLRQNLILLLQLLTVLFLIYALMDFRVHGRTHIARHYILMIDSSASMGASDIAPSRLHWAKTEALKEIDAATDNDYGMVIEFNASAQIRQSYTNNKGQLRAAVESIEQTQRPTRIEEAMSLADSLANPKGSADDSSVRPAEVEPGKERTYVPAEGMNTDIHLYSDGRFPDTPEFALGNLNITYHVAGNSGEDNVGIVTFNATRDEDDASKLQAFVRVLNFHKRRAAVKVQLELLVGGRLTSVYEKNLLLPKRTVIEDKPDKARAPAPETNSPQPQDNAQEGTIHDTPGEGVATFDLKDLDDRANTVLHARIQSYVAPAEPTDQRTAATPETARFVDQIPPDYEGAKDVFPLDNDAWLVVGVIRKARVLLVGDPNPVLNAFFDDPATRRVTTVSRLGPDKIKTGAYRKPAGEGEYDLVIFDRCGPDTAEELPRGNTFFIGHPPPPWKADTVEKVTNPQIRGWVGKHPVMRYLTALQEVGIAEAFSMKDLPPRTPKLIEIDKGRALLITLSRQSFTDLVLTFPLITDKGEWNTNWPLLPSFPLFLRNVLYALGNISDGTGEESVQPGQVKTLRPDVAVRQIQVTDPAGQAETLDRGTRADFSYGDTHQTGVYRVAWQSAWQRSFAVNLLDADESNLEPRSSVTVGAEAVRGNRERTQPRELWKWLVAVAVGLLLTEWYIYNRRVYV
jgi:Aerotolerance regulator N-terminal/von Willebrand factor type A domain